MEEKGGVGERDTKMEHEDRNRRQCIVSACIASTFCLKQASCCLMYPPIRSPPVLFSLVDAFVVRTKTETTSNPTEETTRGIT